jgi:hypothetical protein
MYTNILWFTFNQIVLKKFYKVSNMPFILYYLFNPRAMENNLRLSMYQTIIYYLREILMKKYYN